MESNSPLLDTPLNGIPLDGTTHVLSLSVTVTNQFGVSGSAETTVEVSLIKDTKYKAIYYIFKSFKKKPTSETRSRNSAYVYGLYIFENHAFPKFESIYFSITHSF